MHCAISSVQGVGVLKEWGQEVNRCSYSASPHLQIQKPAERVLFVDETLMNFCLTSFHNVLSFITLPQPLSVLL